MIGMLVSWVGVGGIVIVHSGIGPRDLWIYAETAAVVAAACAVGVLCGCRLDATTAVVAAAISVFGSAILLSRVDLRPFQVATSSGTSIGVDRTPDRALVAILLHGAVVFVGYLVAWAAASSADRARRWEIVFGSVALAAVVIFAATRPFQDSEFRPTHEASTCVGHAPTVCGPRSADKLLIVVQKDLAQAEAQLSRSGLPLPTDYRVVRGEAVRGVGAATPFTLDPADLTTGHLPTDAVAQLLSRPHVCASLYSDQDATATLDQIDLVTAWMATALVTEDPGRAPETVRSAYANLSACPLPRA